MPVRAERWGGFVFVNFDAEAEPLVDFLDPLPKLFDAYHFDQMRFRSYLTTVMPANWKVVVDAFNEAYHVQSGHEQMLPWTDDVSIVYETLGNHAHYGRLPARAASCRPSPRLGLTDDEFDEGEMLARDGRQPRRRVPARRSGDRRRVARVRSARTTSCWRAFQDRRRELLASRGFDVRVSSPTR